MVVIDPDARRFYAKQVSKRRLFRAPEFAVCGPHAFYMGKFRRMSEAWREAEKLERVYRMGLDEMENRWKAHERFEEQAIENSY